VEDESHAQPLGVLTHEVGEFAAVACAFCGQMDGGIGQLFGAQTRLDAEALVG
jgi:hypothetical protein